ncbi:hypothetical protein [Cognatiluteimonas weifangensis]|uniref:YggN family protein n=1 Tax=Cognatiluteimonas weifangensis TaxID=2303539 RepID=A0A372DKW3_9GAMM|nr:hypothetical protein [Luteimonas weifangensis]RFP60144.1 hypothetical protein D0Y53_08930 [Luteimonas weifangensis]
MKATTTSLTLLLALALPLAAQAGPADQGVAAEVRQDLADARKEVRVELARARQELLTENLALGDSLRFGRRGRPDMSLPQAEITPAGDFLVDGKMQAIDASQRRQLLAYRQQIVAIALSGIQAGQEAADAALDAVGSNVIGILFNALSGRLEHRVERAVEQKVRPMVLSICRELPAVMASQQRLSASLPAFRPYATLTPRDIDDCEADVRQEFASR